MPPTLINFALLIAGVILLLLSGDTLVRGAASLARKWGIPSLIVGLTIVAFGTSAPELVVSVQAVLKGASELAIGNVVGSNIANVLMVLGIPALIMAIPTDVPGVPRNSFVAVFATVLLIALMLVPGPLVFWHGAVLFGGIIIYLTWMFSLAKSGADDPTLTELSELDDMEGMLKNIWAIAGFIIFGVFGLMFGGDLIVKNATAIAKSFNVSQAFIGVTIVAIGTSLPELATVAVAAWRKQTDVAIGNVLGSNVFNIFAVLGAAALTGNVSIPGNFLIFDVWVMLVSIIILAVLVVKKVAIGRSIGLMLTVGYFLYIAAVTSRALTEAAPTPL